MLPDPAVTRPTPAALLTWPVAVLKTRAPSDPPGSLGRLGSLEVRLAARKREVRKAQRVRFKVFYEEGPAVADRTAALTRRDRCALDPHCDHLLVIDHAAVDKFGLPRPKVVGTYRLLRQEVAQRHGGFYSSGEFDLGPLLARHARCRFLEIGRSCVLPAYRSKRTIELLWRGLLAYVRHHRMDALIGCASLEGTDPAALALPLSFLHHHAAAAPEWRARALPHRFVDMAMLPEAAVDARRALAVLPPLVKGYLRCGARFGEGAVVDPRFGTTDVLAIMPVDRIDARYAGFFGDGRGSGGPRAAA